MTPLLLAIPLIAAAPVPKDFKREAGALTGAWLLTGLDIDGRPDRGNFKMVWYFTGDSLTFQYDGAAPTRPKPLKADASASPGRVDFDNGPFQLDIYEVVGDTLTIVMGANGTRPANFRGAKGELRYTFSRVNGKERPSGN